MFIYCICTQYLVGAAFALITASIRRGMEVISLWHCWGGMEAQVSLTVAFSSSALLGLVSLIFLIDSLWLQLSDCKLLVFLVLLTNSHTNNSYQTYWWLKQCCYPPKSKNASHEAIVYNAIISAGSRASGGPDDVTSYLIFMSHSFKYCSVYCVFLNSDQLFFTIFIWKLIFIWFTESQRI